MRKLLKKLQEESEKAGLMLNLKKTKIMIQHLAASNYCSASYVTSVTYRFKFSVAVVCIVIFLHIWTINVYFLTQYVVHHIPDISN